MALNPVVFTEKIVRSFLRYQLTTYPFADERLHAQMRQLLSLDETRQSPLLRGPFVSLSRPFRQGAAVEDIIADGVFHPHMRQRIPKEITHLYGHQEEAVRAIHEGKTTLVSTGTGSGKTECFLYPIVSKCLSLRDEGASPGISAVIVYPMNALAEDQLGRMRSLLAGTGIPFGMYVGKTPEREVDVAGIRMPAGSTRAQYEARVAKVRDEKRSETVYPAEEVCSREMMRRPGKQPRILLTNVKQLELLLTRQQDAELFGDARLDFLVFDEAHTFTGAQGAETACLIRRLRTFCGRNEQQTVCVATSATIVDQENPDAGRQFASRFFGVPAGQVATIGEAYERETWSDDRTIPFPPESDPNEILAAAVEAVEDETGKSVREVYRMLSGSELLGENWQDALYSALSRNELVFRLTELLASPRSLSELPEALEESISRPVTEAEVLAWLTLGAAAREEGRPLLRPVVHTFVRGISGAVASFPAERDEPSLWLAAEDEVDALENGEQHAHFPVLTCTTCGQHYFTAFLKDFEFAKKEPGGGEAAGDTLYWEPLEEAQGGNRVVLIDRLIGGSNDEDLEEHKRTASLYFCRRCGTAHPEAGGNCLACGDPAPQMELFAIRQKEDNPGVLTSCLSCGTNGRRIGSIYREPARPVRATNVADVHVLAQDIVHHSERQRLLVFCDNRQDAAFQAGWMKDHARRFRFRALMAEGLAEGPMSVGDLTHYLDDLLSQDEALSRAIVPEVWLVARKEGSGGRHEQERRKYLRIQILREITLSSRQSIGLEPWGRMKIEYEGLHEGLRWIQQHAHRLGLPADALREGVAGLLDYLRRKRILFDPDHQIYSKYWLEGDPIIQQGYLPYTGSPIGTKPRRTSDDKSDRVTQWLTSSGDTTIRQMARKWGAPSDQIEDFLESLFEMLVERGLLRPVTLRGARDRPLANVSDVYQVHADRLRLQPNRGFWQCTNCRRRTTRRSPHDACLAWRCDGTLEYQPEPKDNYDLQLLDEGYSMIRPEEHTAMVPTDERERLENLFKGDSDAVNTFVCTPTLELGVDIGALDAVLMRNVPPLPANYWQRAGRAGRRHRMAVDVTYCRPVSHDRAYFADPVKLLAGRVDPPAFNLRNDLMVMKHVHATVITRLFQYTRDPSRSDEDREHVRTVLEDALPREVSHYLFEGGVVRTDPFDLTPLQMLIEQNVEDLAAYVESAFRQGWPEADAEATEREVLRRHVAGFTNQLADLIERLRARLRWALTQIKRLNATREQQGTLEPEDDSIYRRCDTLIKRLKGARRRGRREAEGYDETNTYSVLSAEGFLPGYGLEVGSILGTAEIPFWQTGAMQFTLPRPPSVALREYVPGNLIYANGHKFVARRFHREVDEHRIDMPVFEVSVERQAVKETPARYDGGAFGTQHLQTMAVCDVDLMHQAHISDEETFRFQMGVAIYGIERDQHNGGTAYAWGPQALHHRRGLRLRLVNVGSRRATDQFERLGYPVCTVCGQSISPLSSERQREQFAESHEERCGRRPVNIGFHADVAADAISLPGCADYTTAYSVLEALRFAATRALDMHMEDLQILVIGHIDREEVDALLWDPMPGGSGLLDQICERFEEVVAIASEIVSDCPSLCETSCIDCLQTFRNGFYHKYLDRQVALDRLKGWGMRLRRSHEIPPKRPSKEPAGDEQPVNEAERRLRHLLLRAGFEEGTRGEQLRLDPTIGTTTPDVIFRAQHHDEDEGVCIYLDGLSEHIHGNPKRAEQDRQIRDWLRNNGYDVIEIAASDLYDVGAMELHFRRLAGYLRKDDVRSRVRKDRSWFDVDGVATEEPVLRIVTPDPKRRYIDCVPLVPLKAAAGAFGDPQFMNDGEWEWVEIDTVRRLREGMFVAKVEGKSMEPLIPDGAYCLFSAPVTGSRKSKIVLVELRDAIDPDTGERYTVKRYESEKTTEGDGAWRHVSVTLKPENPDYEPIRLAVEDEERLNVVAELVKVVGRELVVP